jgi:thiol:disulfide interchange protein DsbC
MLKRLLPALSAALLALPAVADEAQIRKMFQSEYGVTPERIQPAGHLGLTEVLVEGRIVYTDDTGSVLFIGSLIDPKTRKNLTEASLPKPAPIKLADLPLGDAITVVRGNGARQMVTFEDPNCHYCKVLADNLKQIDNVTIHTFLVPILGPDSQVKATQIWCARDRAQSWTAWMQKHQAPSGKGTCDLEPLRRNVALANKLGVQATPAIFFASGERVLGALPTDAIEQKLAAPALK